MPWGGLRQKLERSLSTTDLSESMAPGCPFPEPKVDEETRPWLELLETGTFSTKTLSLTPLNFEVSDDWVRLLQLAVVAGKATWLHLLFLGTHALEVGNAKLATKLLHKSMTHYPSVHAARNLAIMAPTQDAAIQLYREAWSLWRGLDPEADPSVSQLGADLASELCGWLLGNERWSELSVFLDSLGMAGPLEKSFLRKDRILHAQAGLAVHKGDNDTAIAILRENCFPTYGSLRQNLLALWWEAQQDKAIAVKGGDSLITFEMLALRKLLRCDGDNSHRGIDDPCICGPPNLGHRY